MGQASEKRENAIVSRGLPIEEADLDIKEKTAYGLLKAHRSKLAQERTEEIGERVQTVSTRDEHANFLTPNTNPVDTQSTPPYTFTDRHRRDFALT